QGLGRRAMIATLGLAGFRIGEMMDLRVAQVDLQRGRFKLADAKTEAGVREVEITLYLRDELLDYAMDRRVRARTALRTGWRRYRRSRRTRCDGPGRRSAR